MNNPHPSGDSFDDLEPDPLLVASLREGKWILLMWLSCFAWTLTVCLTQGYPDQVDPENFPTVFGLPAWVAWGIVFPWLVANLVTFWFCLFYMEDADLGSEPAHDVVNTVPVKSQAAEGSNHV